MAKRKHREDVREPAGSFRLFASVILALALLAGSVLIMYTDWLYKLVPKDEVDKIAGSENLQIDTKKLGFNEFPLYGSESFYGVENALRDSAEYIKDKSAPAPSVGELLKSIYSQDGFAQALYSLLLISLISIPVYMVLRLLIYNAIYDGIDSGSFLLMLPLRGISALACGISCVCISWVFYNTVLFGRLMTKLMDWIKGFTVPEVALHGANLFMLVVIVAAVIALVRYMVFRGSFSKSVALGIFRSLLFIIAFAFINVFIGDWTLRVVLFGAVIILLAGLIERLFD